MTKKTVDYVPTAYDSIIVGNRAVIHHTLNHPRLLNLENQLVYTSLVLRKTEDGFETENTIYIAVSKEDKQ